MLRPLLAAALLFAAQPATRKTYADRNDGVSFSYPSAWLLNADDDAATAKLRIADLGQPSAVVQLEGSFADEGPYKGTDFEAGAFAYLSVPSATGQDCFAVMARITGQPGKPLTTENGLRGSQTEFSGMVAGTADIHRAVAVFRGGQCFLFETVVIRRSADATAKPLDAARWTQIMRMFDGVLASVRVRPAAISNRPVTTPDR